MKVYSQLFVQAEISVIARKIIDSCSNVQVIALQGTLGTGKTTLSIEILRQLGAQGEMQSPTYTYLQAYKNNEGKSFFHFDLYRLQDKNAFLFAGFDEFLYQPNSLTVIEWPEIIEPLIDRDACYIKLQYVDDVTRKIEWYVK